MKAPSRKLRYLALGAVGVFATIGASPALAAKPPKPPTTTSASCPKSNSIGNRPEDPKVAAFFSNSGDTTTYTFSSLDNETGGTGTVPGLIEYCVYPAPAEAPTDVDPTAVGGEPPTSPTYDWISRTSKADHFSFVRPGGNESNIPLDATTDIVMGTADWNGRPGDQTILLHVADSSVCTTVDGTCFVKPKAGPICDAGAGDDTFAYNSMPFDVIDCSPPSLGFEATQTREFGDEVVLDTTNGTTLEALTVDFQSYGCSDSGHWYQGVKVPV
jgi:hypothetical protein